MMYSNEEKELIVKVLLKQNHTPEDKLFIKMRRIIEDQENKIKSLNTDISLLSNYARSTCSEKDV